MAKSQVRVRDGRSSWWVEHRQAVGWGGALVAAGLAAVWVVVVPEKADAAGAAQAAVIRWGHPVCWVLLAVAGVAHATGSDRVRDAAAWAALGCYAAFLGALAL